MGGENYIGTECFAVVYSSYTLWQCVVRRRCASQFAVLEEGRSFEVL